MKIEIVDTGDENFQIGVNSFKPSIEVMMDSLQKNGETPPQEIPVERIIPTEPSKGPKPAPLENPKSNNFDLFSGTSWQGRKQGFN